ncbi:TIGR02147 family protein [bacterium]|nr:TIGR02147 family protein [bacterium]
MSINLYSYTSYREYLDHVFESMFKENPRLSYRALCRMAGYSSPNFIRFVVLGKRDLTSDGISKIAKLLKLNKKQTDYFSNLVQYNQAESLEEKTRYFEKICHFKSYYEVKNIDHKAYLYFSRWYYPVIREMAYFAEFKDDPNWVAARLSPRITPAEASEALKTLFELGFLIKNSNKRVEVTDKHIRTSSAITELSVYRFHQEMIKMALKALDDTPEEYRQMLTMTVAADKDSFLEAKKRIEEFAHELGDLLTGESKGDTVYQVNMHMFNLTAIPERWKK